MESQNSVMLETCGEDTVLIQTVKDIVRQEVDNELEGEEEEEGFFVVTDVRNEQTNHMDVSNEDIAANQLEERISWSDLCRVCANVNDHLIPIFDGEGLQHELCNKIHKYLPIHISETDTLPLQLCYHCAATLLAWHELSEGCLNAERRLLEMQDSLQDKHQYFNTASSDVLEATTQDTTSVSTPVESLPHQQSAVKDEVSGESTGNSSERWQTDSNGIVQISPIEIQSTKLEEVDYVECAQCDIVFVDTKCLINHMNKEHDIQVHYCQHCMLIYRGQAKDFEEHVSTHNENYQITNGTGQVEEPLENEQKIVKENLKRYEETIVKSVEEEKPSCYICNLCDKNFTKKSDLKKHISSHPDARRVQNPDETELVNKARQMIDDRISYKCDVCKKLMFTKRGFLRHIRVHSGKRPCKCELCGKCYRIEQDLARHVRDVHEGLKKYACDICGRAFANKGAKDDHRRIHTGERPYACEHCPKTFRTLNSIYIHNRVHTNYKPHKCSYCGKYFRSKQRLTNHETTHTGVKAFSCEICGKSFSVKGEVMRHRAIHNQEKPFDCKGCGMKFGQKRYLRNHIKQHHKEESFVLLSELTENRN